VKHFEVSIEPNNFLSFQKHEIIDEDESGVPCKVWTTTSKYVRKKSYMRERYFEIGEFEDAM